MLADVRAGFDDELLEFAIKHFAHAFDEQAIRIAIEQRIPVAAPEDLDHVPTGAAESGFEFLHDLAIAANRTIETLQVAIDDEDQVVEIFAGSERDGAESLGLIGFTVAEKCPDFGVQWQALGHALRDSG